MSERGSFVTEYIYCDQCLEAAKKVLLKRDKFLCAVQVDSWCSQDDDKLPIIAGKVGSLYPGGEVRNLDDLTYHWLATKLCHPLRIAVLTDNGQHAIVKVTPR